jgi:hypothetical protein
MAARIVLSDEGELGDVRCLLRELGFAVARAEGPRPGGEAVLISSVRCAFSRAPRAATPVRFHAVVTDRVSARLRRELERLRPDFVLERPVDATVLRLLVQHALHEGTERRRGARVPMRTAVRYRLGRRSHPARLIELSEGGCRLETKEAPERGQRLTVLLPLAHEGAGPLALEGRVVKAAPAPPGVPGSPFTSVAFLPQDAATRSTLRRLVTAAVAGGGALRPRASRGAGLARSPAPPRDDEPPRPAPPARRRSPRGAYRRSVLASHAGGAHVLIGRDLSCGGMRVNPDPRLLVGQELKLVIHGRAGRPPVVVKALVARDEGADGCVLHVRGLSSTARCRLEAIVQELPDLRAQDEGARGPNVVVSEVVGLAR